MMNSLFCCLQILYVRWHNMKMKAHQLFSIHFHFFLSVESKTIKLFCSPHPQLPPRQEYHSQGPQVQQYFPP